MKLVGLPGTNSGSSGCSGIEHGAAALGHEVEAVIEELAEEREHQVERRRQAEVGRDVRDEQRAGDRIGCAGPPQTKPPEPHGFAAAATAAGLPAV